jgi:hypothetical protein
VADGARNAGGGREFSLPGILLIAATTFCVGLYGLSWGGPMGGLLGALGGALVGFALFFTYRAVHVHRSLEGPIAPQVLQLPPEQALSVLSAMVSRDGGQPVLASDVLGRLATIKTQADTDLDGAIVEAEQLRSKHPRSPAIPAEIARLHRQRNAERAAATSASQALALALTGGMNSVAARVYEDFSDLREHLDLAPPHWKALSRALSARDHTDAATWCQARAESTDQPEKVSARE